MLRGVVYRPIESLASIGHSSIWKLICAISVCNTLTVDVHLSSTPSINGPASATGLPGIDSLHHPGMPYFPLDHLHQWPFRVVTISNVSIQMRVSQTPSWTSICLHACTHLSDNIVISPIPATFMDHPSSTYVEQHWAQT